MNYEENAIENLWNEETARGLDEPELLRYRSNCLEPISLDEFRRRQLKITQEDSISGQSCPVLWVKGSGGDLGSIKRSGFATLYMEKICFNWKSGIAEEDEMVGYYPLAVTAASMHTPLHGFLPFTHIDHLHPTGNRDSCFGKRGGGCGNLMKNWPPVRVPWQRPGFELGLMLREGDSHYTGRMGSTGHFLDHMDDSRGEKRSRSVI